MHLVQVYSQAPLPEHMHAQGLKGRVTYERPGPEKSGLGMPRPLFLF